MQPAKTLSALVLTIMAATGQATNEVFQESFCVTTSESHSPSATQLAQFDAAVRTTGQFVRYCDTCDESHKEIVYKRLTPLPSDKSFGDIVFNVWASEDNELGVDFKMYSSLRDANRGGAKAWKFCNYDDETKQIGFPRDCGPKEATKFQWNTESPVQAQNTAAKTVQFCTLSTEPVVKKIRLGSKTVKNSKYISEA